MDALNNLNCWQESDYRSRSSILHWANKVAVLASQVAEEAMEPIVEDMRLEEIRATKKDNHDEQ
jgi:phage gp46-like protein